MKTLFKAIAIASLASTALVAQAETTANLGYSTSYQFRGVELADGNTMSGSLSTNLAGLSAAVTILDASDDDQDFQEVDLELGYSIDIANLTLDLGYVQREYTFDTVDAQNDPNGVNDDISDSEFSVSMTASGLTITYVDGEIQDDGLDQGLPIADVDYDVLSLGYSVGNIDITLGQVDEDNGSEFNYYEISTGTELFGLDTTVMLTNTFSEDAGTNNQQADDEMEREARIVVSLSKAIDL